MAAPMVWAVGAKNMKYFGHFSFLRANNNMKTHLYICRRCMMHFAKEKSKLKAMTPLNVLVSSEKSGQIQSFKRIKAHFASPGLHGQWGRTESAYVPNCRTNIPLKNFANIYANHTLDHPFLDMSQFRRYSQNSNNKRKVLGIETSCDDTGAAVVDEDGRILGECLNSQTRIHVEAGGIIPPVARDLHRQNIEEVVQTALRNASTDIHDVDAIAATVKPGLTLSLSIGLNYARDLIRKSGKPFLPIHHMEAHALTARMLENVDFPFLVLLISGGHALLAVVRGVEDYLLLGHGVDDAPGDAFDKTARSLKLKNLPECSGMSGGQAIEKLAKTGDPLAFELVPVMSKYANCNFSFAGIKFAAKKIIQEEEKKCGLSGNQVLENANDICASFQYFVLHHLAKRLQRALLFCEMKNLLPHKEKTLVLSGGVASNEFIRRGLQIMCSRYDCRLVCPPPHLCTDNGIMIAWNGMEKLKAGVGVHPEPDTIRVEGKSPLGKDCTDEVARAGIKLERVKLL